MTQSTTDLSASPSVNSSSVTVSSADGEPIELDAEGHLCNHRLWTPQVAQQLADSLAVELTPLHLRILTQVRAFYDEFNHPPATRPLIKYLIKTLPDDDISNQALQSLFNTGLVARHVNRLAGLPKPPNCL